MIKTIQQEPNSPFVTINDQSKQRLIKKELQQNPPRQHALKLVTKSGTGLVAMATVVSMATSV